MSERDKDIEKGLFDGEQPDIFIAKKHEDIFTNRLIPENEKIETNEPKDI